jgi:hypothetical protein
VCSPATIGALQSQALELAGFEKMHLGAERVRADQDFIGAREIGEPRGNVNSAPRQSEPTGNSLTTGPRIPGGSAENRSRSLNCRYEPLPSGLRAATFRPPRAAPASGWGKSHTGSGSLGDGPYSARSLEMFPEVVSRLKAILERFADALSDCDLGDPGPLRTAWSWLKQTI